jgi:hypothetical protein
MPISIQQSQKIQLENGFVGSSGSFDFTEVTAKEINALFIERAEIFKNEWISQLNSKKIIASGNIENVDYQIVQTATSATLNISFPYYAKFVDKGVKGVRSSKNAPDSPYKFKNYGMSAEGRKSIANWLRTAKAKVRTTDVKKYGAKGTEKKFKKISEFDQRLEDTIFNIKKYGIKKRDFIEPTIKKSFEGFEKELSEVIGKTITINIFK